MRFLPLVWRTQLRRKVRTTFTLLSIVVAFVLFGYLSAIRVAFGMGVEVAGADRMLVIHKVSLIQPLPESYLGRIAAIDGVEDVSHMTFFGGIYQDPRNFFAQFAVDGESYLRLYPELGLTDEEKQRWLANRTGAVVDRATADRFGWSAGDRIPLQGTIWRTRAGSAWEFTIDGIIDGATSGAAQFLFHYEYLAEANVRGRGSVGQYVIRVDDPARSAEIAAAIDSRFANSPAETRTTTEQAFLQSLADQLGNVGAMLTTILGTVFFTLLLITTNTMAQAIRERTSELAVLKTLGFTNGRILALVLLEAGVLAVVGGTVGLGLVSLILSGGDPTGGFLPEFAIPPRDLTVGACLVVALGAVSATWPGLRATRLRIVDGLGR
ncbi:MAG: ABC transporter permease [Acidobacteria bacterium]|nr:ABC transporter permease [Acidobacteriota bacterium]